MGGRLCGLAAAPSRRTKLALDMQLSRESLRHAEGSRPRQGGNRVLSKDWNWACEDGSHESNELLRTEGSLQKQRNDPQVPLLRCPLKAASHTLGFLDF